MASMMCVRCSSGDDTVEFPSVAEYIAHEKGGHVSRPEKISTSPPPKTTLSATEIAAGVKEPGRESANSSTQPQKTEEIVTPIEIPPLRLEYKWIGNCKTCQSEVKTITVDLGKKAMIIAYCFSCDKKLEQKQVVPLSQQELEQGVEQVFERNVKPK